MSPQKALVETERCSRGQLQFTLLRHSWTRGGGCMSLPTAAIEAAVAEALGTPLNDTADAEGGAKVRRGLAALAESQLLGPDRGSHVKLIAGEPAQVRIR